MAELSSQKSGQRLRLYIGESDRWRGKPLDTALLETLRAHGIAGATVFRGAAGFGAHSRIRTTALEVLSMDLPVVIESIDTPEKIAAVLEVVSPMVREGLITLEDVQIIKYTHRYRNPLPADRFISEVMSRNVISVTEDAPVSLAWKYMLENLVKTIPVVDSNGRVTGMLTDEDLIERVGIRQRLSVALRLDRAEIEQEIGALEHSSTRVSEVMSRPAITILEATTLGAATKKMVTAGVKRLPVVNQQGMLVGMLSRLDILRAAAGSSAADIQQEHIHPQAVRWVRDIMNTDVPVVQQDEELQSIIEKFARGNLHRLIVVDLQGQAIGLLSDSDVVARVQPSRRKGVLEALRQIGKPPPGSETAADLMSPGPMVAPPDLPIADALRKMLAQSRKWLVVVDGGGKPVGFVDRQMLLEALAA